MPFGSFYFGGLEVRNNNVLWGQPSISDTTVDVLNKETKLVNSVLFTLVAKNSKLIVVISGESLDSLLTSSFS